MLHLENLKQTATSSLRVIQQGVITSVVSLLACASAHSTTLDTATLSIAPTGTLDLENNFLIVRTGDYATIEGYLVTGYNGGAYNGFGINSGLAAAGALDGLAAVGNANNADASLTTFGGVALSGTEILARYTYLGDANLSGSVTGDDYAFTDAGFFGGATDWLLGDFNYSGTVDGDDYALLDAGFFGQGAALGGGPAPGPVGGLAAVPEPAAFGLMAISAFSLLLRRSRRVVA